MSSSEVARHRLRPNVFGATRLYTLFFNKGQCIRMAGEIILACYTKATLLPFRHGAIIVAAVKTIFFNSGSLDEINGALTLEQAVGGLNVGPVAGACGD